MKKLLYFSIFLFSFSFAQGQSWIWGTQGSSKYGSAFAEGMGVAADNLGNSFGCGYFNGRIKIGNDTLRSTSLVDRAYLIKYNQTGTVDWAEQSKGPGSCDANGTTTDILNNVYSTGVFRKAVFFGPDTLIGSSSSYTYSYVVKYTTNGNVLWAEQSKNGKGSTSNGVCTDKNANTVITGNFTGPISFGTIVFASPGQSAFVVKYDSTGTPLWGVKPTNVKPIATSSGGYIAADSKNNLFVAGSFTSSIRIGPDTLTTLPLGGTGDMFIAKYKPNGTAVWAREATIYNLSDIVGPTGIAVDKYSNSYVTGVFMDSTSFGPYKLVAKGSPYDIFIVKYDSMGTIKWAKTAVVMDSSTWEAYSVAVDTNENLYISLGGEGRYTFRIKYDTTVFLTHVGPLKDGASVIMKLDTAGNLVCGSVVSGGGDDQNGVACNAGGHYVYFGGDFWSNAQFGQDTLTMQAYEVPFMAEWLPCNTIIETGEQPANSKGSVVVFPNPSKGVFTFSNRNYELGIRNIEVYNVMGEKVQTLSLQPQNPKGALIAVNLSAQPSGIYFYRVIDENGELASEGKLIIQK